MHVAAVQIRIAALAGMEAQLLRPGATLAGKVLERNGAVGLLMLAGTPVVAELPDDAVVGARLRLRVTEVGPERVTLQLVGGRVETEPTQVQTVQAPPAAAYALALPGGAMVRLHVDEREAAGGAGARGRATAVALRYDSPTLGRMDFRIAPNAVAIHATAGEPAQRAAAAAEALRTAIEAVTGTPTQVTVHPRGGTLDVRG